MENHSFICLFACVRRIPTNIPRHVALWLGSEAGKQWFIEQCAPLESSLEVYESFLTKEQLASAEERLEQIFVTQGWIDEKDLCGLDADESAKESSAPPPFAAPSDSLPE